MWTVVGAEPPGGELAVVARAAPPLHPGCKRGTAGPRQCIGRTKESLSKSNGDERASWFGRRNLGSVGNCSRRACRFGCAVRRTLCLAISVQHPREKLARVRLRIARHLLGRSRRDDLATLVASFG